MVKFLIFVSSIKKAPKRRLFIKNIKFIKEDPEYLVKSPMNEHGAILQGH